MKHPAKIAVEIYDKYMANAMANCEGDIFKAEEFLNCGMYLYYERMLQRKKYIIWHNEETKKMMDNSK